MRQLQKETLPEILAKSLSVAGRRELSNSIYQALERYCELPDDDNLDFFADEDIDPGDT